MKDTSDFLEVMRGRILARGMRTDRLVEEGLKAEGLGVQGAAWGPDTEPSRKTRASPDAFSLPSYRGLPTDRRRLRLRRCRSRRTRLPQWRQSRTLSWDR